MSRIAIISSSLIVFSVSAQATDNQSKTLASKISNQAVNSKAIDWTSCSVGFDVGGGVMSSSSSYIDPAVNGWVAEDTLFSLGSMKAFSSTGGANLGCDIQNNQFVFGVGASLAKSNISGENSYTNYYLNNDIDSEWRVTGEMTVKTNWIGSLTARSGFLLNDTTLVYAKGGFAWMNANIVDKGFFDELRYDNTYDGAYNYIGTATMRGWTLGLGIEARYTDRITLFAENNFYSFPDKATLLYDKDQDYSYQNMNSQWLNIVNIGARYRF